MKSKKIVYVLKEKGTTFYRIGSTHSIEDRLRTLNQGNPRGMELFYSEEFNNHYVVNDMERKVQRIFSKYHHKDSWYNVPHISEIQIGAELKELRMKYDMEQLKEKQNYERELYWINEYRRIKSVA